MRPDAAFPQLHDPAWLAEQYLGQQRSLASLAREIGCSPQAVQLALVRHRIPRRAAHRRRFALLADEHELRRRYVELGESCPQIAADLGCSATAVRAALKAFAIPREPRARIARSIAGRRDRRLNDADWLRRAYLDERWSMRRIADHLGCTIMTVHRALNRHGIPRRRPGQYDRAP
jgi:biotin operon repressor